MLAIENKSRFFKYVNGRLGRSISPIIVLRVNNTIVSRSVAADMLDAEFSKNCNSAEYNAPRYINEDDTSVANGLLFFNSQRDIVNVFEAAPTPLLDQMVFFFPPIKK